MTLLYIPTTGLESVDKLSVVGSVVALLIGLVLLVPTLAVALRRRAPELEGRDPTPP